jgi:MoaA/NifB/PqqE/SkfB family radical SAM enzyme
MSRTDGLYTAVQRQVINQMLKLAASDDKSKIVKAFNLAEKITPAEYKGSVRFVAEKVENDHPALTIARHVTSKLSPRCRDRFIECLIVNTLLRGIAKRKELIASSGMSAPTTILMSPTMRCNLTCEGCYAAEYPPDKDLDRDLLQKIVDEGNEMGVYLYTMLGGEPFMYDELLDFARTNKDSYFQVFTNGTLLDHDTIDELAEVGNVAPMLSLEGTPELTDRRRGEGVHQQVMEIMDYLGEKGVLFGYSVTVARNNWRTLVSDEFVDPLIAKGAMLSWNFLYMPVGRDPNTDMMLTPEERNEFRVGISRMRDTKPIFPIDFWGDAPWVNGCIAGKHYMHINSEGWVEPCIFTHFATDNIRETSLFEAFNSTFFREIRSRQPFNHNLLMPCMLIDNPHQSREIMALTGARPTHHGAESMFTQLRGRLDAYSAEVDRVYDPIWSCMIAEKNGEPVPAE